MPISDPESVTKWIGQLQAGDPAAAQKLWERYFHRLVWLARKKLREVPRRAADEEDVALSAFASFWRGAERGRFPQLADRNDLWRLLVVITARKASRLVRHETSQKRGGPSHIERNEHWLRDPGNEPRGAASALEQIADRGPTPEFAAQVAEEYQRLLAELDDRELQAVALWKMEGYTTGEIAAKLGCVPRTVERKLRLIRSLWEREVAL